MNEPRIKIYTPASSVSSPFRMIREMFSDLSASRELAWRLAVRDISAQYRQAILGILWAFILPLANTAAWIFLNNSGIVSVSDTTLPYSIYVFVGTMLWAIFMDALNAPLQQAIAAKPMLAKLNFPREALVVSGIYQTLFNAIIKILLLFAALVVTGHLPDSGLILFPLGILSLVLVGTAIGLLVTPLGMLYTDVGRAMPLLMQFLMYITPVVFPIPKAGFALKLFHFNPLTPIIVTTRDWLTGGSSGYLWYFLLVNVATVFVLLLVWVIYRLAMPILIERMSA